MNLNYNYANSEVNTYADVNENEYDYYDAVRYHSGSDYSDKNYKKTIERLLLSNALD